MRPISREVSLVIVFASLYATLVVVLAPISFHPLWQVRVADALLPLSIVFGLPCAVGLGLGCLIGNIFGGLGAIDIIGGSIANLAACITAYWIGGRGNVFMRFLGTMAETAIITAIVGGYLSILFNMPPEIVMLGIFTGSLISINLLGFMLEETVRRRMRSTWR